MALRTCGAAIHRKQTQATNKQDSTKLVLARKAKPLRCSSVHVIKNDLKG